MLSDSVDTIIANRLQSDSALPGFLNSWAMQIRRTQPGQVGLALTVQFVAFDEGMAFTHASAKTLAWLWWPKQIEHSVSSRQAEFLFGRLAARHALAQLSPTLANALVPMGSDREPVWPEGVLGSITHVVGLAGAAVVPAGSWRYVGIDLERTARGNAQLALRASVLDSAELALLQSACEAAGQSSLDAHVTHIFSAKECLYKAAFPSVRRFFGFSEARLCAYEFLHAERGPEVRLALEITDGVGGEFIAGSRWWIEVWWMQSSDAYLSVLAY